jgi:pyruvate-ferredoxin/flavodoxin oxidoreductase
LFRYNPALAEQGRNPLQLDSKPPSLPLEKYIYNEARYTMLVQSKPGVAKLLLERAQQNVAARWRQYEHLAALPVVKNGNGTGDGNGGGGHA